MNNETSELNIGSQVFWGKIIPGILWVGAGITGMFKSISFQILHMIFLIVVVLMALRLMKAKCEKEDEMAKHNLIVAKAKTRDIMHIVFCAASIFTALGFGLLQIADIEISFPRIVARSFFILMGIQDIITGIIFRKLEAE